MFERVFFVLSPGFHGATILSKILNAHPEIVSLGDTYPSNRFDQVCGCGKKVSACPFWQTVKKSIQWERYADHPAILPVYPKLKYNNRIDRYCFNILPASCSVKFLSDADKHTFAADFHSFVKTIYKLNAPDNPKIFIDGVKSTPRVLGLAKSGVTIDGIIHLYRHPGNFAKSYCKNKGQSYQNFAKSLLFWRWYHYQIQKLRNHVPYFPLTYEMLGSETDKVLAELFEFIGVEKMGIDELRANFDQTWHFMGNASLFRFDGRFYVSRHELSGMESLLIRLLAGTYNEQCAE